MITKYMSQFIKLWLKLLSPHCQYSFSLEHLLPLLYRHLKSRLHGMWQRLSYQICAWLNVKLTSRTRPTSICIFLLHNDNKYTMANG